MSKGVQYGTGFAISDVALQDAINPDDLIQEQMDKAGKSLGEKIVRRKEWERSYNVQLKGKEFKLEVFVFTRAELKAYVDQKIAELKGEQ